MRRPWKWLGLTALIVASATVAAPRLFPSPLRAGVWVARSSRSNGGVTFNAQGFAAPDIMIGFSDIGQPSWSVHLRRLSTGRTESLDALKRRVNQLNGQKPGSVQWAVSPDGKWLLWGDCSTPYDEFFVVALDGSTVYTWRSHPPIQDYHIFWRSDSRAWMLLERSGQSSTVVRLRVYPLRFPETVEVRNIQVLRLERYLVGVLQDGRVVTGDAEHTFFSLFDPQQPSSGVRRIALRVRRGWDGSQVALSPRGDRLAWCVVTHIREPKGAVLGWLHRWLHPGTSQVELFVTDLEGDRRLDLGTFEASLYAHGGERLGIYGWMPDGKSLLFERGREGTSDITRVSVPD
jgi:hypothetical protein